MTKPEAVTALERATSEAELQVAVIDLARLRGWLVHHTRPARLSSGGWRTPIQGHPGFVDLVKVRQWRVIFAELKRQTGRVSADQTVWLDELAQAAAGGHLTPPTVEVDLWRPSDWLSGAIAETLR